MLDLARLAELAEFQPLPGTVQRGHLRTAGFAEGVCLQVPVIAVIGRRPGKTLVVVAAQHGREVNGPAAVYEALASLPPDELTGQLILFPVANPLCVRMQVQDFPTERGRYLKRGPDETAMNLNRQWPGDLAGSLPQRVAHALWNAAVSQADCILDLHSWTATQLPLAWSNRAAAPYLEATGFPWFEVRPDGSEQAGTVDAACAAHGIPCVVCEMTPQDVVDPRMAGRGSRGILNLARHLGLLPGSPIRPEPCYELDRDDGVSIMAEHHGLVVPRHQIGSVMEAGEAAVDLIDLDSLTCLQRISPPRRMLLRSASCTWGTGQLAYSVVRQGETVASFSGIARELPAAGESGEGG